MRNLKQQLSSKLQSAKKIAVLGVGSEFKADDSAGLRAAGCIQARLPNHPKIKVIIGGTAPENCTGEIREFAPSHLIVIDAANEGDKPGALQLLDPKEAGGFSCCTHMLPLAIMFEYLSKSLPIEIIVIGITPKEVEMGQKISRPVREAANRVGKTIVEIVNELLPS